MAKDIEIEVKFPLKNTAELAARLNSIAKLAKKDVFQKDTYFIPAHRNFLAVKRPYEWLRLRETAKGAHFNYKHFYPENVEVTEYCDEFETNVESADAIRKILASLDFKDVVVVEKKRSTWMFKDVEIAIDDIKGLGPYIEAEAKKEFETPKKAKEYLRAILKEIGAELGDEELRGYPFIILNIKATQQ
jgi:adenylate cyclase class 2